MYKSITLVFCAIIVFEYVHSLHQGCMNSSWCVEENSYCSPSGFCSCRPGFSDIRVGFSEYICISTPSVIGAKCSKAEHCTAPATCKSDGSMYGAGDCTCPSESHAPSLNRTHCLLYADKIGSECRDPAVCDKLSNSECYSGYCMCKTGHVSDGNHGSCLKIATQLSEECIEDVQCRTLLGGGTICAEGSCFCKHGYAFNADRTHCLQLTAKVGDACEINEQCVFHLGHAKCTNRGVCQCTTGYEPDSDLSNCELGAIRNA